MKTDNKQKERFDWTLAFILLIFCLISLFAILLRRRQGNTKTFLAYSLTSSHRKFNGMSSDQSSLPSQCIWSQINIKKRLGSFTAAVFFYLPFYTILPESLELVAKRNGAKSWFHIPGIGSIQPAEFMKTFFIIGMARMITKHHEKFIEKTLKTDFLSAWKNYGLCCSFLYFSSWSSLTSGQHLCSSRLRQH